MSNDTIKVMSQQFIHWIIGPFECVCGMQCDAKRCAALLDKLRGYSDLNALKSQFILFWLINCFPNAIQMFLKIKKF